jgi:hypothetical protein
MMLYGWLHKANAQSQAGLEQYYYMDNKKISFSPVAWYQLSSGWYAETRYNYEAENTLSLYMGKTFENRSAFSYAVSTMAGAVIGEFNGGAAAVNADVEYKQIFFSLQTQYTFSVQNSSENFIYTWSDIGYRPLPWLSAGLSLQQTNLCNAKSEKGAFIKLELGAWTFPFYIFQPQRSDRYAIMGLNFTWQQKKRMNTANITTKK